jgi:hypothetical protein
VALPTPFSPGAALLPIPTRSQTATVARLSGGGGGVVNAGDDPFWIAGESDRVGTLVLADEAGMPGVVAFVQ